MGSFAEYTVILLFIFESFALVHDKAMIGKVAISDHSVIRETYGSQLIRLFCFDQHLNAVDLFTTTLNHDWAELNIGRLQAMAEEFCKC